MNTPSDLNISTYLAESIVKCIVCSKESSNFLDSLIDSSISDHPNGKFFRYANRYICLERQSQFQPTTSFTNGDRFLYHQTSNKTMNFKSEFVFQRVITFKP